MSKVLKIGITKNSAGTIDETEKVKVVKGKGVVNDRHFKNANDPKNHITLIESENIDYYNRKYKTKIPYLNFRRNLVTQNLSLNNLIGKKIRIRDVIIVGIDLCRPCKHLQEILKQNNIIKEFLLKGGLRCQVLTSGEIYKDDTIDF